MERRVLVSLIIVIIVSGIFMSSLVVAEEISSCSSLLTEIKITLSSQDKGMLGKITNSFKMYFLNPSGSCDNVILEKDVQCGVSEQCINQKCSSINFDILNVLNKDQSKLQQISQIANFLNQDMSNPNMKSCTSTNEPSYWKEFQKRVHKMNPYILPKDAICGDGICNQRVETNFDCPKDCNNAYVVVDPNKKGGNVCNDHADGSVKNPLCSITQAVVKINDGSLGPGSTIYLRGGEHIFGLNRIMKGGLPNRPITIRNFPDEKPILEGGLEITGTWTKEEQLSSKDKNVFSMIYLADDDSKIPNAVAYEIETHMGKVFQVNELKTPYDHYFYDCGSQKLYIQFSDLQKDPNDAKIYSLGNARFDVFEYTNLIGLESRHAMLVSHNPYTKDSKQKYYGAYNGVYDSTIRSSSMGIGDFQKFPAYWSIIGNRFINIGSKDWTYEYNDATKKAGHLSGEKCVKDVTYGYSPITNRWFHALYGFGQYTTFAYNYVDQGIGGTSEQIGIARNSKIFNNIINGNIYKKDVAGDVEIYNNIIYSDSYGISFGAAKDTTIKIKDNIIIAKDHPFDYYFPVKTTIENNYMFSLEGKSCIHHYKSTKSNTNLHNNLNNCEESKNQKKVSQENINLLKTNIENQFAKYDSSDINLKNTFLPRSLDTQNENIDNALLKDFNDISKRNFK